MSRDPRFWTLLQIFRSLPSQRRCLFAVPCGCGSS